MNDYKLPKVIAEIGCNHKGDFDIAKQLIQVASDCGVDVVKFQKRNNNQLLNKEIIINTIGYQCLSCNSNIEIYRQGYCKNCFFEVPQAADWIIKPELSKAHLNIEERDLNYEKEIQLQPHIVYLANTGNIKVGVTRKSQTPYRWIDQGAHEAITLLEVPNRFLSGLGEVALKSYYSDKTNWRKMLQNESESVFWNEEYNK